MQIKPGYSLDTSVAAIRSFYEFLIYTLPRQNPSSSTPHILEPPPGGWPNITAELLAPLRKTAAVIELLRRLPYLASDGAGSELVGPETTRGIRYNGPEVRWCFERGIINGTLVPFGAGTIPPHVAVLTEGSRYGSWLLLDTDTGTVTDYIQQERPARSAPGQDSPDYWRAYHTLPVETFFREWRDNYRRLEWAMVPGNPDDGVMFRHNDRATDEARAIYRAHGWPDTFRREECRQALLEWDRRKLHSTDSISRVEL